MRLFQKGYLKKEKIEKLKKVFYKMVMDVIDDFDPNPIMDSEKYVKEYSDIFIERLGE